MGLFNDAKNQLGNENNEASENNLFDVQDEEVDAADIDAELLESILEDSEEEKAKDDKKKKAEKAPESTRPVPDVAERRTREARDTSATDETQVTLITKGTTINGSIISDCSLDVMGTINGDIECLGKLTISGKVTGNSMASEVFVNTDRLDGSITCEGCVKISQGTIVVGDITASSAVFAGAIKGEVDVNGPIVLDSTAIIKGNIKAKSVQMNNGAVLDGSCSLAYAELDIDSIFE
ncbi:MAG: polymer-forming cytoskeletal protein [Lachnospiraceae bacterium]|nr:polymer-forming cytoskeletal protein [Lachnospiraceae bacterium]